MSRDESLPSPISIVDVLLVAFGLFLLGLAVSNLQDGHYLTAASDGAFGVAGLAVGLRPTLERVSSRELMVMNYLAIGGAALGFVLLIVELLV